MRSGSELYGKITSTPSQQHLLAVGYRYRPNEVENAGIASDRAASVATDDDNSSRLATASWSFFATDRTVVEVKYLHLKEKQRGGAGDRPRRVPDLEPEQPRAPWASTPIPRRGT